MKHGELPDTTPPARERHRLRWFVAAAVLAVAGALGGFLWYGYANRYVGTAAALVAESRGEMRKPNLLDRVLVKLGVKQPRKSVRESLVDEAETMAVLTAAVTRLDKPEDRMVGLDFLIDMRTAAAPELIARAVKTECDPTLRSAEILLLGLYRDKRHLPILREGLRDVDPAVRAAAADAIGVLHSPAYNIPIVRPHDYVMLLPASRGGAIVPGSKLQPGQSGICIEPIVRLSRYGTTQPAPIGMDHHIRNDVIALDPEVRAEIERMMTDGATTGEREAAARALLGWPEEKYRLRLAEWGVWIADAGKLVLAQSVVDEIPPFVHRTGNTIAELNRRMNQIMDITKPIIHLTADRPIPVDLEVRINAGRPWFAYPMPDDFGMTAMTRYGVPSAVLPAPDPLQSLDDTGIKPMPDELLRVGYPWSWPNRKVYGSMGGSDGAMGNVLTAVGIRWQSVIVCPKDRAWMAWAAVPDDPRFAWWKALRNVPSSAVTSRGETERFLYYDGPTLAESPVLVQRNGRKLSLQNQRVFPAPTTDLIDSRDPPEELPPLPGMGDIDAMISAVTKPTLRVRKGLAIDVADGQVSAWTVAVPAEGGEVTLAPEPQAKTAAEAEAALRKLITEAGGMVTPDPGVWDRDDHAYGHAKKANAPGAESGRAPVNMVIRKQRGMTMPPNSGMTMPPGDGPTMPPNGLTAPEAEGLIRSWRKQFFQTPGRRFLLLLTRADYDAICPMWIRPAPTEIARVGLVLTEFE